jgi:hypothetical protein
VQAQVSTSYLSSAHVDLKETEMTQPTADEDKSVQTLLRAVLTVTVLLSILIRIGTPGWMLILFGIPLLIVTSLHVGCINGAIQKIPDTKPMYSYLILLSNLFFFLGFVLQVDFDDSGDAHIPIFLPFFSGISFPFESKWTDMFSAISVGSFIALVVSWILLLTLHNSLLKREKLN